MITKQEKQIALDCKGWAEDKKAEDPLILDLSDLDGPAALFLICSGTSTPQLKAITASIEEGMKEDYGLKPYGRDGKRSSDWLVLDYGLLMVHVLSPQQRAFYQLEDLWQDAKVLRDEG
jgi:ribosome-associated protein